MIKQSLDNVSRLLSVTDLLPVEQHRWLLATSVLGMTCSHRLVPYYLSNVRSWHRADRQSISQNNQSNKSTQHLQPNTFNPCFCTTVSSFSDNPLGRLTPLSHFCTVETLVFR